MCCALMNVVPEMPVLFPEVRKDGGVPIQTSLTDLKPPAAPNHTSKRLTDMHGRMLLSFPYFKIR